MRATGLSMGMPISVDVPDVHADMIATIFGYFDTVDRRFSPYRADSEVGAINAGASGERDYSSEMREVLVLADKTRRQSGGYFDVRRPDGRFDPSGIVKGWAIRNAARILERASVRDFFVDAGGDIQSAGVNAAGEPWRVGIRNPFCHDEIVKVLRPQGLGVATSGSYARGQHIYDPHAPGRLIHDVVSLTVIGPDVLEADRFATAAYAMGRDGIAFVEATPGLEGYLIDTRGRATMTSGFEGFVVQ